MMDFQLVRRLLPGVDVIARMPLRALALMLVIGVSGCAWIKPAEDGNRLAGERISVLTYESKLKSDPKIAKIEVRLPRPFVNKEWPQAGGLPHHAMQHLAASGPLAPLWDADIGTGTGGDIRLLAQPVAGGGAVFTLDSKGRVSALDALSGKLLWRYGLRPRGSLVSVGFGGGLAYDNGRIYATTGFGQIIAMQASDGAEIWRKTLDTPIRTAPTIGNGRIFVITNDNQLYALTEETGEIEWSYVGIVESAGLLGGASPALFGETLIAPFSSGELVSLRAASGLVGWVDSLTRTGRPTPMAVLNDLKSGAVIDRGRVYSISHSGRMAAVDLRSGQRLWERDIAATQQPWIAGDFIFVVSQESELVCLHRKDGGIRWVQQLARYEDEDNREEPIFWAGPILVGDRLLLLSSDGYAMTVSPYDGSPIGRLELADAYFIPPLVANEIVYILSDDGQLQALR